MRPLLLALSLALLSLAAPGVAEAATPVFVAQVKKAALLGIHRAGGRLERMGTQLRIRSGAALDEVHYQRALATLAKQPAAMAIVERFRAWHQIRILGGPEAISTEAYLIAGERYTAAVTHASTEDKRLADEVIYYERRL